MAQAYALFGLAAGVFGLITLLALRASEFETETKRIEKLILAIVMIASIAAILFGATAWYAWKDHQCQDPRYVLENPTACVDG